MTGRPRRRLALIALGGAAALAVLSFPFRATWWGGWILAIAEAGIVGGLADWFAVTALFRRPMGLPIPHTALIPSNWELMAARVGTMVGDRVLTREYVTGEIARIDVGDVLARAAERITRRDLEMVTAAIAAWAAEALAPARPPESFASSPMFARIRKLLGEYPIAPTLASALDVAREHGWDQRVIGGAAQTLADAFDRADVREAIRDLLDDLLARYRERMGTYPRVVFGLADLLGFIDRERIVGALAAGLRQVAADPHHPLRERLVEMIRALPARLRSDAAFAARVETAKLGLLESAVVARVLEDVATELRRVLSADLADPHGEVVAWIADRLEQARRSLIADAKLREAIDGWLKTQITTWLDRHHARIATFIENGVRALGPEGAVRLIEEHAGDDLQFIRVNGTVVGGLAGGALYAVHLLLRLLG